MYHPLTSLNAVSIIHYHHCIPGLISIPTPHHDGSLLADCLSGDGVDEQKIFWNRAQMLLAEDWIYWFLMGSKTCDQFPKRVCWLPCSLWVWQDLPQCMSCRKQGKSSLEWLEYQGEETQAFDVDTCGYRASSAVLTLSQEQLCVWGEQNSTQLF